MFADFTPPLQKKKALIVTTETNPLLSIKSSTLPQRKRDRCGASWEWKSSGGGATASCTSAAPNEQKDWDITPRSCETDSHMRIIKLDVVVWGWFTRAFFCILRVGRGAEFTAWICGPVVSNSICVAEYQRVPPLPLFCLAWEAVRCLSRLSAHDSPDRLVFSLSVPAGSGWRGHLWGPRGHVLGHAAHQDPIIKSAWAEKQWSNHQKSKEVQSVFYNGLIPCGAESCFPACSASRDQKQNLLQDENMLQIKQPEKPTCLRKIESGKAS